MGLTNEDFLSPSEEGEPLRKEEPEALPEKVTVVSSTGEKLEGKLISVTREKIKIDIDGHFRELYQTSEQKDDITWRVED